MKLVLVMAVALSLATARGEDSMLKNGSFCEDPSALVPTYWKLHMPEGADEQQSRSWIKLVPDLSTEQSGVELSCPAANNGDFGFDQERDVFEKNLIFQDIAMEQGQYGPGRYLLRWKAKGTGKGFAGVYPREGSGSFQRSSREFQAEPDMQEYEVLVDIPADANFVRVIVQAADPDSTVVFSQVELVPAESDAQK